MELRRKCFKVRRKVGKWWECAEGQESADEVVKVRQVVRKLRG